LTLSSKTQEPRSKSHCIVLPEGFFVDELMEFTATYLAASVDKTTGAVDRDGNHNAAVLLAPTLMDDDISSFLDKLD